MPMMEFTYSYGALTEQQLGDLMQRAIKVAMWWEKIADTPERRATAWTFATEMGEKQMLVGGLPPPKPRYRYMFHTFEGLMDDGAKLGLIRDLTRLTLEVEGSPVDDANKARIWCIMHEHARADWGVGGALFPVGGYKTALSEIKFRDDQPLE